MRAARWDLSAEIGGTWRVSVERHVLGSAVPLASPCTMDFWRGGYETGATPTLSVTGVLTNQDKTATFVLSSEQLDTLGAGDSEHRVVIGDPTMGPVVIARGWMTIRAGVRDL